MLKIIYEAMWISVSSIWRFCPRWIKSTLGANLSIFRKKISNLIPKGKVIYLSRSNSVWSVWKSCPKWWCFKVWRQSIKNPLLMINVKAFGQIWQWQRCCELLFLLKGIIFFLILWNVKFELFHIVLID